ncbi:MULTISPECIES: LysM peptidoglycan-binding domain-containing protein [Streptomyces]|uniref:Peptidoglycan-binding protein n=1 Tax=Streptomyces venezuelae TaxID=54571 RepID=A0A5P2ANY5_STRVZ|nr:LysM peptidoglycan-binding domain-containing protein [Streptomyces venezuelae]QES18049.1 peptidoglycan-binding protein [Streptomyces venezuelae]
MPAHGKHRRPRHRTVSRGLALAGTGGVALALPLVIPATAGAETVSAAPKAVARSFAAQPATAPAATPSAPAAARTYTVVSGDSLSLIAQKKGIQGGWKSLYRVNKSAVGDNPSLIHPGLELTIRRDSAKPAPAPAAAQKKASPKKSPTTTERASRSERRAAAPAAASGASAAQAAPAAAPAVKAAPAAATRYADNLDGWIRESLDIMAQRGIPGTYDGILRNVMRESSGNPQAINNWDSNAAAGTPSKGLLQVIQPTFDAYHVPGTSTDLFDPVANITAACNYAADRYGSIDNVNGPY